MMASKAGPTNEDYETAARLGLLSLNENQDPDSIMEQLAAVHPRNNTFPAEVLLELAADAISESGASQDEPTQYEGIRDRYLPEYPIPRQVRTAQEPLRTDGSRHDPCRRLSGPSRRGLLVGRGRHVGVRLLRPGALRPSGGRTNRTTTRSHRNGDCRASRNRSGALLTTRNEGHDNVGGVTVEVLSSAVVNGGRSRIGVAGGDLDIAKRDSCIEGRHNERGPEHVRMDDAEPGPLADRADPSMSGPAIEPLAVLPPEDGTLGAFADH